MSRKKNSWMPLIAILLIALAIFFYYPNLKFEIASDSGFSTLSVQRIDFISNNSEVGGPAYVVTLVANGQGEKLSATLTPDLVKQFTGKQTISGPVEISVNLQNQTCNYPINLTDKYVWKADASSQTGCNSIPQGAIWSVYVKGCGCGIGTWLTSSYSVAKDVKAQIATVSSATVYDYVVNVSVKKSDGTIYTTYLNPNILASDIGGAGRIKWIGSLTGSQSCPTPASDTILMRDVVTGQYTSHSSAYYGNYLIESSNIVQKLEVSKGSSYYQYNYCAVYSYPSAPSPNLITDPYNSLVDQFIASKPLMSPLCSVYSISNNLQYICTPTQPAVYPTMQLVLRGDVVGVILPTGKPQITSVPTTTLYEGGLFTQPINVKNIGEAQGVFSLKLDCEGTTPTFRATTDSIQPNEEKQFKLEITSLTAMNKICNITLYDINSPTLSVKVPYQLVIQKQPCAFECCNGTSYQEKACPETRDITTLSEVFDPAYFNVTAASNLEYAQKCSLLPSGSCWKQKNITKTYKLYCQQVTCQLGDLLDVNEGSAPLGYVPEGATTTTIIQDEGQPPVTQNVVQPSFSIMKLFSEIWNWIVSIFKW